MSQEPRISEEMQNAFVDGQLDADDWARMVERMARDPALRQQLCELRAVKDMVKGAYGEVPAAPATGPIGRGRRVLVAAASVVLAVGIAIATGWFAHGVLDGRDAVPVAGGSGLHGLRDIAASRVLVHVSSSRPDRLGTALDEVEDLLRAARAADRRVEVEIVANSTGLDLLRVGASPFEARVAALRARYPNLYFFACNQTIDRLREKGVAVELLPAVQVAPSALDEVVRRLQGGWVYIRA